MSVSSPTLAQLVAANIANIEARLGQTTPIADRAFVRVLATVEAMAQMSLYKYAFDRVLAGFAQSAAGSDLDYLAAEFGLKRQSAVAAQVLVNLPAADGTSIPAGTLFNCQANGLQYQSLALVVAPSGGSGTGANLSLVCLTPGISSNLANGSTLGLQSSIAGAQSIATVSSTSITGADGELDTTLRQRVLDVQRAQGGGGNAADYRAWAQTVAGVARAYPYSGSPPGSGITSVPGMRTVYVECVTSLNADGIPSGGLLTQVRSAITTDPGTGLARQPLGLTDTYLYVQAIIRTGIYVTITSLSVPSGLTSNCQADILAALTTELLSYAPFVQGVDPSFTRKDTVTSTSVAATIQGVLNSYGASVASVAIGVAVGIFAPSYQCAQGEKLKLAGVVYQ